MQAKQFELQARQQIAEMEMASRQQIAQMQIESQMQIAHMRGTFASQDAQAKILAADRDREDTQAHEVGMAGHAGVLSDYAAERDAAAALDALTSEAMMADLPEEEEDL